MAEEPRSQQPSDLEAKDSPPGDNVGDSLTKAAGASGRAKKPRSPVERAIVRAFIGLLILLVISEWYAQRSYHASLEAINVEFEERDRRNRDLTVPEAEERLCGLRWKSIQENGLDKRISYRWPSLFKTYLLEFHLDARGILMTFSTAADEGGHATAVASMAKRGRERGLSEGMERVVALKRATPRLAKQGDGWPQGLLLRELPRQAVLIAARDELGLATRDQTLREEIPDFENPRSYPLESTIVVDAKRMLRVELNGVARDGKPLTWASSPMQLPQNQWLEALATGAEELSRTALPDGLRKFGYDGKPHPWKESRPLDPIFEDRLLKFDIVTQFGAVRELHRLMAMEGESPELLEGLARGYANLGSLTSYHWSPAHAAFAARGMLYAERLIARTNGTGRSMAHRAYVRALTGLHKAALRDIEESREAFGGKPPSDPLDEPHWVEWVRAFCAYEPKVLSSAASEHPRDVEGEFVRYLQLLWAEQTDEERGILAATEAMRRINPACGMAMDVRYGLKQLGVARESSALAHADTAQLTYPRMMDIPNLPPGITAHVRGAQKASFIAMRGDGDIAAESQSRQRLIKLLKQSGSPTTDNGEPSWDALGQLVLETGFADARRLLEVEGQKLSVPIDKTLAALKPMTESHPYAAFLEWYHLDKSKQKEALDRVSKAVAEDEIEMTEWQMTSAFFYSPQHQKELGHLSFTAHNQLDDVFRDQARYCSLYSQDRGAAPMARKLMQISPHWPVTAALAIRYNWKESEIHVAEWEAKFSDDVTLSRALSKRLREAERDEDAERVIRREIERAPSLTAWRTLAEIRLKQNDEAGWRQALEKALTFPGLGLEHSVIHAQIAGYEMDKKDFKAALPHALAAAQSYSSNGLLCAARCKEGLNDLPGAEAFYRANAERYSGGFQWFLFCHRTGAGDLNAAKRIAESQLTENGRGTAEGFEQALGLFRTLTGNPKAGLASFQKSAESNNEMSIRNFSYYFAIALADELGEQGVREKLLTRLSDMGNDRFDGLPAWQRRMFPLFRQLLQEGLPDPVPETLFENVIVGNVTGDVTAAVFFAGHFLAQRGEKDLSRRYLRLAATSSVDRWSSVAAADWLRRHGEKAGPRRATELDGPLEQANQLYLKAVSQRNKGELEEAAAVCSEILALRPELTAALTLRGSLYRDLGRTEEALADLDASLVLLPRDATARAARGDVQVLRGNFVSALDDYRMALQAYPTSTAAVRGAAWVQAVAADDSIRNGKEAARYARQFRLQAPLLTWRDNEIVAAGLASDGKFDEAVSLCDRVLSRQVKLAPRDFDDNVAEITRQHALYKAGRVYEPRP